MKLITTLPQGGSAEYFLVKSEYSGIQTGTIVALLPDRDLEIGRLVLAQNRAGRLILGTLAAVNPYTVLQVGRLVVLSESTRILGVAVACEAVDSRAIPV